ncbi:alpha/beta hydrolase fold-domain-containing protein [Cristinia sonorae]|uniref:Alpha/beta hydrolase fold-domain-containing protein n=1 Tax=Cristinia sonorae TaxID=1940300 RepID=A0A8K0UPY9_9AGAR|nr:alpha/beta hydrolase fold-domain-containing protein [Cristinia sonorae]
MASATDSRKILQPIHPDFVSKLLPEYVAHHNATTAFIPPIYSIPWDPSIRNRPAVAGGSEPLKVGFIKDIQLSNCAVRVFTPEGITPSDGWPVFVYFHGGGWCLGNIDSENSFATRLCKHANCVVVSVDYRLGPEHPYPAAVDDAWDALQWVYKHGESEIQVNTQKIAVGGSSSGGNLAAVLTHKASQASPPIPLVFQLLVVPVTDNTAGTDGIPYPSWLENANTPALDHGRMLWFRDNYLPNVADRSKWDNSPIFAPDDWFKLAPKAWIGVAERDILRDEGIAYGEKLKAAGVEVDIQVYKGAPHPIMAQDGTVLEVGRRLVSDAAVALAKAFESS